MRPNLRAATVKNSTHAANVDAGLEVGSTTLSNDLAALKVKAETTSFATFLQVYDLLKNEYVERDLKDNELVYGAIRGMLGSLDDPYTRFMDPKAFQSMQDERQGSFGGIGIQIGIKDGKPNGFKLYAIRQGSIYDALGLQNGDTVNAVNGQALDSPEAVMKVFRQDQKRDTWTVQLTRRGQVRVHTYRLVP